MQPSYRTLFAGILPLFILSACGGGGGGGDDDDSNPLDPTVDYDLAKAQFGTPGVSRTESGSGSDSNGFSWVYSRTFVTLASPDPTGPCLASETQIDDSLTLTEESGFEIVSFGPECFTTSGFIQQTLGIDESNDPDIYTISTAAGDLPLTTRIGDSGSLGSWSSYADTNGDLIYDGMNGDAFLGSGNGTWQLEEQMGKAALVLSFVSRDETGTQDGSETVALFITPSGSISDVTRTITIFDFGTINLSGSFI